MYTVVKQTISRLTVATALIVTLITSIVRAHQSCGQDALVRCAQPLQVLTDTGLTFVASKKDLDIICPDLRAGLKCVHSYTRRCMSLNQRSHFNKLFHGTNSMVKELCSNGTYQEEYLKYAPCMRKVVPQNEICFKQYQTTMEAIAGPHLAMENHSVNRNEQELDSPDVGIRGVCCSFQEYVECSTHTTRMACGEEAARFSRGFLDKMSSSMIKLHCTDYFHGSAKCPSYYSHSNTTEASFLTVLLLTLLSAISTIVR